MNFLLSPVLAMSGIWIGGGSAGIIVVVLILVLLFRR